MCCAQCSSVQLTGEGAIQWLTIIQHEVCVISPSSLCVGIQHSISSQSAGTWSEGKLTMNEMDELTVSEMHARTHTRMHTRRSHTHACTHTGISLVSQRSGADKEAHLCWPWLPQRCSLTRSVVASCSPSGTMGPGAGGRWLGGGAWVAGHRQVGGGSDGTSTQQMLTQRYRLTST